MPLSCACDFDCELEPGQIVWEMGDSFEVLKTKIGRRCLEPDCRKIIKPGELVTIHGRWKVPEGDYEESRFGEDGQIERSPKFLCEKCSDMWFNLAEHGFDCIGPWEVWACLKDYVALASENKAIALRIKTVNQN